MFLNEISRQEFERGNRTSSSNEELQEDPGIELRTLGIEEYEDVISLEDAMSRASFGRFNVLLLAIHFMCMSTYLVQISAISYIIPILGCDMGWEQNQKSALISSGYFGTAIASLLCGLISPNYRRKYFIIISAILYTLTKLASVFFGSFYVTLIGEIIAGFFAGLLHFLYSMEMLEYHRGRFREALLAFNLLFHSLITLLISGGAWVLFENRDNVFFEIGKYVGLRKPEVYLVLCAIPGIAVALSRTAISETPEYFMRVADPDKALEVVRRIYSANRKEEFPFNRIVIDRRLLNNTGMGMRRYGSRQIWKKLCRFYRMFTDGRGKLPLFCLQKMIAMAGLHSLRMWIPSFLANINEYFAVNKFIYKDMCSKVPTSGNSFVDCTDYHGVERVYFNVFLVVCLMAVINIFYNTLKFEPKKKAVITTFSTLCAVVGISIFFCTDVRVFVFLIGVYVSFMTIVHVAIFDRITEVSVMYDPTFTVYFAMAFGRLGVVIGVFFLGATKYFCYESIMFIVFCSGASAVLSFFMPLDAEQENGL